MSDGLPKILVVDDTLANLVAMRRLLGRMEVEVIEAASGNQALAACLDHDFALILLDVQMPDMDGFEVAQLLSEEARTRDIPVIFVTAAFADDMNRLKAYRSGAVDYIAKPVNDVILLSKVQVFLDLNRGKMQMQALLASLNERNRQLQEEIARREKAEIQIRHQAAHDPLTGLANRMLFMDRLAQALDRSNRSKKPCALLYLDIDGFKPINDLHSHRAGDQLLRLIGLRISERLRKTDTLARIGGDEFAVIMEEQVEVPAAALKAGQELCELIQKPYELDGGVRVTVGVSIGVAFYPKHGSGTTDEREAFIHVADTAMYTAKKRGRNQVVLAL